jgi:hypothetical protein
MIYRVLFTLFLFTFSQVSAQIGGKFVNSMILDTDIGPDYDDVGAMAVMHALADKGEVKPLAVISSNQNELVVPTIEILNTYFGRPGFTNRRSKRKRSELRCISEMA